MTEHTGKLTQTPAEELWLTSVLLSTNVLCGAEAKPVYGAHCFLGPGERMQITPVGPQSAGVITSPPSPNSERAPNTVNTNTLHGVQRPEARDEKQHLQVILPVLPNRIRMHKYYGGKKTSSE